MTSLSSLHLRCLSQCNERKTLSGFSDEDIDPENRKQIRRLAAMGYVKPNSKTEPKQWTITARGYNIINRRGL